jgi:hypothetical protein
MLLNKRREGRILTLIIICTLALFLATSAEVVKRVKGANNVPDDRLK